jgi:hypothetical protein
MFLTVNANDQLTYANTITLANTLTWTGQTHVTTLEFNNVLDVSNTDIGWLITTITPIVNTLPSGTNNYTLSFSANNYQTTYFLANSVNPNERTLVIQTKYTANNGFIQDANNIYLKVKNSSV